MLGLVIGKPLGVSLASWLAVRFGLALPPVGVSLRGFLGAACLCGVGDTVALLMADQAFASDADAAIAKLGVLLGSTLAGGLGALVLVSGRRARRSSE